jgi:hypothetical protein
MDPAASKRIIDVVYCLLFSNLSCLYVSISCIPTVLGGKPEGKRPLGYSGVDGRIIFKWIFEKWDVGHGLY